MDFSTFIIWVSTVQILKPAELHQNMLQLFFFLFLSPISALVEPFLGIHSEFLSNICRFSNRQLYRVRGTNPDNAYGYRVRGYCGPVAIRYVFQHIKSTLLYDYISNA